MDVDSFKRLLLTGNSAAPASRTGATSTSNTAQQAPVSDSSSNTDTASVSRQSIFEPLPPLHADTPRTSQEISPGDVDDELRRLVINDEKKKPPPPKTRHGKLIKSNPIIPTSQPDMATDVSIRANEVTSPMTPNTAAFSDLDKPLPLTPHESSPSDTSLEGRIGSPLTPISRRPPTPPMARRQSQKEPGKAGLGRSGSSRQSHATSSENTTPSGPSSKAPPAPPARRGNRSSSTTSSINQTIIPDTGHVHISRNEHGLENSANAEISSIPSPTLARNASMSSTTSNKRASRPPGSSMGKPPAPPPPRRGRNSSHSSMDAQQPTGLRATDAIKASGAVGSVSDENEQMPSGSKNANDILADLAALQREVDSLRLKQSRE